MSPGSELAFGGETTSDDRLWGLLAHLSVFVFPFFGALIIYLVKKNESRFVAYHAIQSGIFQVVLYIIGTVTCGFGFLGIILPVLWAIKANRGEWEGYPLIASVGQ